jgi:hypothetical protein
LANNLTQIMGKILAASALHLRKQCVMPKLVNSDLQAVAAQKGATIDVEIPEKAVVKPVVPGPVHTQPDDSEPFTVPVTLDYWEYADWFLTDRDLTEIDTKPFFLPQKVKSKVIALADRVNETIFAEYKRVYGFTGVPGQSPFKKTGTGTPNEDGDYYVIEARRILTEQLAPKEDRSLVLDGIAEAGALGLQTFKDADRRGDGGKTKASGEIGHAYGMDFWNDNSVPTHTAGTLSNGTDHKALLNGAKAAGSKTMNIDSTTLTGTVVTGDIFRVAGDSQTYVVTSGPHTAASNAINNISFEPAVQAPGGWADNAVITFEDTHTVNLAFNKYAFAFVNRRLEDLPFKGGTEVMTVRDDESGLTLRLTIARGQFQTMWYLDFLWGVRIVQPELACRIAG